MEKNINEGATNYKRPSWDNYFLEIMDSIAKRGTCERGRSGCVIARDKQIVAAGYVGSPIGEDHCDEVGHLFQERLNKDGSKSKHCVRTVHAEQNAICQAARRGVPVDGATLYCKMTPCPVCAKMIINCGIKRVVCAQRYHDGAEAERLFLRAGVALEHVSEEEVQYKGKGDKDVEWRPEPIDLISESPKVGLKVKIKKLYSDSIIPNYAYADDAGMDLYATETVEIPSGSRAKIGTGISIELPEGYVSLIWDKSGVSIKKGLKTLGGVIDAGYRGEYFVGVANISKESLVVSKGEKIAQLLIQKVEKINFEVADELSESERGEKTLGSSGDKAELERLQNEEIDAILAEDVDGIKEVPDQAQEGEGQDEESRW